MFTLRRTLEFKKKKKIICFLSTCADEQDVIRAVHSLHSVHQQLAELVVNTYSDQEGTLSQWQHMFLKKSCV